MAGFCLSLSQLFGCGFFLVYPMCRSCSGSFLVLSETVVPRAVVDLVCLWEVVSSGSSYVTILSQNSVNLFLI